MIPEEKSRRFETIYRLSKEKLELLQKVKQLEAENELLKAENERLKGADKCL